MVIQLNSVQTESFLLVVVETKQLNYGMLKLVNVSRL